MESAITFDKAPALHFAAVLDPSVVRLYEGRSVEEIEDLDGTPGLCRAFEESIVTGDFTRQEQDEILNVLQLATELHEDDRRRDSPDGLFIAHPIRAAIDAVRLGIRDASTIKAILLHDSVEDHAKDIIERYSETPPNQIAAMSPKEQQQEAVMLLGKQEEIGEDTAMLVAQVTNEPTPPDCKGNRSKKVAHYVKQVRTLFSGSEKKDIRAKFIKMLDQYDNAIRNHRTQDVRLQAKLDGKYAHTIGFFINFLRDEIRCGDQQLISTEARLQLLQGFEAGHHRTMLRILRNSRAFRVGYNVANLTFRNNNLELGSYN